MLPENTVYLIYVFFIIFPYHETPVSDHKPQWILNSSFLLVGSFWSLCSHEEENSEISEEGVGGFRSVPSSLFTR